MGVRWQNKAAFFRKLDSIVPAMANEVRVANAKSVQAMVTSAVAIAPRGATGNLQASIRWGKGRGPTSYIFEAGGPLTTKTTAAGTYDYAIGIEFGNRKTKAHSFFWSSYRLNRRTFKGRITRAINKAIKKVGFVTNGR